MLGRNIEKFGAKGAVLNYIHKTDQTIPIEPFILVPAGADWRDYFNEVKELGDNCLIRSSSPLEDGERTSFAGLFQTCSYDNFRKRDINGLVQEILRSVRNKDVESYAKIHNIEKPISMALIFQKNSNSKMNWGMIRHPHKQNIIFIQGRDVGDNYLSHDLWFNEETKKLCDLNFPEKEKTEAFTYLLDAISAYKKIEKLPAFQTGYAYHMEFGTSPLSIYQFRPFRKKETANWKLDKPPIENGSYFELCFGITPPEGIELKLVEFDSRESPMEEIEKLLIELNKKSEKEKICLSQNSVHWYYGKDIDLIFPNAKVWVPDHALEFVSHDWFRAMQHYDIALTGNRVWGKKIGDKVRVYSNGVEGVII